MLGTEIGLSLLYLKTKNASSQIQLMATGFGWIEIFLCFIYFLVFICLFHCICAESTKSTRTEEIFFICCSFQILRM